MHVLQNDKLNKIYLQSVSKLSCCFWMNTSEPCMCDECSTRQLQHVLAADQQPFTHSLHWGSFAPPAHTLYCTVLYHCVLNVIF